MPTIADRLYGGIDLEPSVESDPTVDTSAPRPAIRAQASPRPTGDRHDRRSARGLDQVAVLLDDPTFWLIAALGLAIAAAAYASGGF